MRELSRERGKALTGYAYLLTGDMGEAEDLVRAALVRVFSRSLDDVATVDEKAVRRAVVRLYVDRSRRRRPWLDLLELLGRGTGRDGAPRHPARQVDVEAALMSLPPEQRACVVLRFHDDLTVPEIADRLSLTAAGVKRDVSLAVHRMEALLGPVTPITATESVLVDGGRS